MPQKRKSPLQDQQGLAMILVLCLGALFVALAAALVYASSLMMANANRQLPEQDVYELAVSFSDVLEQELLHYTGAKADDSGSMAEENDQSIGYFINHIYVKKGSIDNPYGDDTDHTFTLQAPDGIDAMTVTLNKHPSDDMDESGNVLESYELGQRSPKDLSDLLDSAENDYSKVGIRDYDISVTVKVVKGDESYAYTRKYQHYGFYQVYYTLNDKTNNQLVRHDMDGTDTLTFYNAVGNRTDITIGTTGTLYQRYRMDADTACRFTRITADDQ